MLAYGFWHRHGCATFVTRQGGLQQFIQRNARIEVCHLFFVSLFTSSCIKFPTQESPASRALEQLPQGSPTQLRNDPHLARAAWTNDFGVPGFRSIEIQMGVLQIYDSWRFMDIYL